MSTDLVALKDYMLPSVCSCGGTVSKGWNGEHRCLQCGKNYGGRPAPNFRPSIAHRWLVCYGSARVEAQDPESEYAADGTRKHRVLDMVLSGEPILAGDVVMGNPVEVQTIEQCFEVREFIEQFAATHPGWAVVKEREIEIGTRVWPGFKLGELAGRTDAAAFCWDELLVMDAKFGFVKVDAYYPPDGAHAYSGPNPQLALYALGLLGELDIYPIQWVTLCIAQPDYDGQMVFREHRMSAQALREWALEHQYAVEAVQDGSWQLKADERACRYCPARTQCPARLKMMDDAMHEDFFQERPIESLIPYIPVLRAIARDIEGRAMGTLGQGQEVPGWKLVASRGRRQWKDPQRAADNLSAFAVDVCGAHFDPMEHSVRSPAQMTSALYDALKSTPSKLIKKAAKNLVDSYVSIPEGGPKLVPESDPRPALPGGFSLEDMLKITLESAQYEEDSE